MACAISGGYAKTCRDDKGGVVKVYVTEKANLYNAGETRVETASGQITAIALNTGKKFYTIEQGLNVASYNSDIVTNRQNGAYKYDQTLTLRLNKRQASLNYFVRTLAQNDLAFIAEQANGKRFLLGEVNGLSLDPSKSGSGVNQIDGTLYDLVFKGEEPEDANEISSAAWDSLVSGSFIS